MNMTPPTNHLGAQRAASTCGRWLAVLAVAFGALGPAGAARALSDESANGTAAAAGPGEWTAAGPLGWPRRGHTATLLPDGKVLLYGSGGDDTDAPANGGTETFDPSTGLAAQNVSSRPPRRRHCATLLPSGLVLVAGGDAGSGEPFVADAMTYDPSSEGWTLTGPLNAPREFCTATLLPDGRVLVVGGGNPGFLGAIEAYDPATGTFAVLGQLAEAREFHTATLLPDGRVMVAGGAGAAGRLTSIEIIDPSTGRSTPVASLARPRGFHTATLLPDGTVLIAGGDGGGGTGFPERAERFDPRTNTVRPAAALHRPRRHHTATLLPDGTVLLAGGDQNGPLGETEFYDPVRDAWIEGPSLTTARSWHTATLLPDGRVLVAGGRGADGDLASTEVFTPAPPDCVDPPPGLSAWWDLDEVEGTVAIDRVGGHDGQYVGDPTLVPDGHVSTARHFDGTNQHIAVPDDADGGLDLGYGGFAIQAWVRLAPGTTGVRTIVDKRAFSPVRGYALFVVGGNLALQLGDGSAPGDACSSDPTATPCTSYNSGLAIDDGRWHLVGVTVDRSGLGTFMVDERTATFDASVRAGSLDNDAPFLIGRHARGSDHWQGDLDEVALYGWAVPSWHLGAIHAAGRAGMCKANEPAATPLEEPTLLEALDEVFRPLDAAAIPSGILLDKTLPLSHLAATPPITGVIHTRDTWRQLYREMFAASFDRTAMTAPEDVAARADAHAGRGVVPIAVLDFDFHRIRPDAVERGLLIWRDGQLHDPAERGESPYAPDRVFAAALLTDMVYGDQITFQLAPELFFTNGDPALGAVEIDFDDGLGFRAVRPGEDVAVAYADVPGARAGVVKTLRLRRSDRSPAPPPERTARGDAVAQAQWLQVEMEITIVPLPQSAVPATLSTLFVDANGTSPGTTDGTGKALVFVRRPFGHSTACFAKPVIFVEGIDFGSALPGGGAVKRGDLGFINLETGTSKDYPQLAKAPLLLNRLALGGFDVAYIDFWDGAAPIQENAVVLRRLIEHVRDNRCDPAVDRLNVIGASMGGLVSRYALAKIEQDGTPPTSCSTSYISFDAPHQGANIPFGAQHFVYFMSGVSQPAADAKSKKLDRPAAKQLLVQHYDPSAAAVRQAWHADLTQVGYPQQMRRVAVVNGSGTGKSLAFQDSSPIVSLTPFSLYVAKPWPWSGSWEVVNIYGTSYAAPGPLMPPLPFFGPGGYLAFSGRLKVKWLIDTQHRVLTANKGLAYDNAPGGTNDALKSMACCTFNTVFGTINVPLVTTQPNTSFIPTISSLDIAAGTAALKSAVGPGTQTPFDAYFAPGVVFDPATGHTPHGTGTNEAHVTITDANIDYLMARLADGGVPDQVTGATELAPRFARLDHSVLVAAGGTLSVNGPAAPALPGGHFAADVVDGGTCGSGATLLDVATGGSLVLGDAGRTAELRFQAGTTLQLRAGAKLVVNAGSRLILEPGATLIYEAGAEIQLQGDDAVLEIRGATRLGPDAAFAFTGSGHVRFAVPFHPCAADATKACPSITAAAGSRMLFQGAGPTDTVLEVAGDMLWPEDSLALFRVTNGRVAFSGGARLNLGSRYTITGAELVGNGRLTVWGRPASAITSSRLEGVSIEAFHSGYGGVLSLTDVDIDAPSEPQAVYLVGGGLAFNRVTMSNVSSTGVHAIGRTKASYIVGSTIAADEAAIVDESPSGAPLSLRGTVLQAGTVGLDQIGGHVSLKCSMVRGGLGSGWDPMPAVRIAGGGTLNVSGLPGGNGGYNDLAVNPASANAVPLRFVGAAAPYLDFGYNALMNGTQPHAGVNANPILAGTLIGTPAIVSASHNQWNSDDPTLGPPNGSDVPGGSILLRYHPSGPIIPFDAPSPGAPPACGHFDPPNPPDPFDPSDASSAAALFTCPSCPVLGTRDFPGVPYHDAIRTAMTNLARDSGDQSKDDLAAIRQLAQILGTTVDASDGAVAWLQRLAYHQLNDAFGNALATEQLVPPPPGEPPSEPIAQVLATLDALASPERTADRDERAGYALHRALVLRQVGRLDEAVAALEALYEQGPSPAILPQLSRWLLIAEAEARLARGDLAAEAFADLARDFDRLVPAPVRPMEPIYLPYGDR